MADDVAVVVTGGDRVVAGDLPETALVIAADSGLERAADLGLSVDLVVGDLDSVSEAVLAAAEEAGAAVERHPADKDATDLELALLAARDRGAARVVVLGGAGGRLDHLLGNALLLASPAFAGLELEWRAAGSRAVVVRDSAHIDGDPGDLVTLLPLGGPATGITTAGLRWPLAGETLSSGSTRGVSNQLAGDHATVEVGAGVLLAIHTPGGAA